MKIHLPLQSTCQVTKHAGKIVRNECIQNNEADARVITPAGIVSETATTIKAEVALVHLFK